MKPTELWILDRLEDAGHAVLVSEEGDERIVPPSELPEEVREGDALRQVKEEERGEEGEGGGARRWEVDREATRRLREEAEDLRSSLRRGPSGPLSL